MEAGIVVYKRKDRSLIGDWSHEKFGGKLARETVRDVADGPLIGDWAVEIFTPDGQRLFTGSLNSTELGDCLKLRWVGTLLLPDQKTAAYEGIGRMIDVDTLVASFEEVDEECRKSASATQT